jgi:hypothetical protein
MKRKYLFVILIIFIFFLIFAIAIIKNYNPKKELKQKSKEYQNVLNEIEKGNRYILQNGTSDSCFPYRYYHRGCYYEGKFKFYNGLLVSDLRNYNLTDSEKIELCYKFIFNGSVAYCLSKNNHKKCIEFASNDSYLSRICNLKKEETIPTESMWDPNYKENPIPTVYISGK